MNPLHTINGFEAIFQHSPEAVCFAPGRVNLMGEHTDYNGGYVFPCALHLGIYGAAIRRTDRMLCFFSANFPHTGMVTYSLDDLALKGCWADYPVSVIRAFAAFGYPLSSGMEVYFSGDLPDGAGLSSSAALEVATGVLLRSLFALPLTQQELALIGQFAENRLIGVNCGIMDQFVCAMGQSGHALLLDTNTLSYQYVPLEQADLVIVNSGVRHSLASSSYNDRRRECETARAALEVPTLCSLTEETFADRCHKISDETCRRRAHHVVTENQRTLRSAQALRQGDLAAFGCLMNASHASLRDDYEVSCEELDFLVDTARSLSGVYGARMTGGGFGGCTVNLMEPNTTEPFASAIQNAYQMRYHRTPFIYPVRIGNGAHTIDY